MTAVRSPIAAVIALGITQIVGYGTLYYSFSILAHDMAKDLSWPVEWLFGALSAALLVGGLTAPWLGNWIDRYGAGRIMTAGSAVAAAALVACAAAPEAISFVIALVAIQVASNLVQYGAAFALLVQISPRDAQRNITYLTLIAGFASTAFWPITTALHAQMSWQAVYLVFAVLNLVVCLPLHAWLSFRRTGQGQIATEPHQHVEGSLAAAVRPLGFALMVIALSVQNLVSAAILVHMVPLLSGLGLGATAAVVSTLFGPAQVLSRFINMVAGINLAPLTLAIISAVLMTAGVGVLLATAPSIAGAMTFAVIFGMGNGLFSIVTGALPLALFGSDGYGRLQGRAMSARLIVSAVAPFALAFAMATIGISWALSFTILLGVVALAIFVAIGRLAARSPW
ncbi:MULTISPECIES: arsenite efflux MFS transporter ArsK [Aminobacter]|uniref:MFS family permease n=1 Tax=Aminobacter ciceronei TaxID=150723 RepID=A0ABR6BZV3_9HYPH|nr:MULTISPECIES: arsenite efflux MFS transporter ArsK [Aminobacter]MBA8904479.1 MFS family permease [Aminobacter ciceronei]MBA9018257.1 MFS family permease [Aminobacter ciceronei]QOF70655.1 arsenite efflux MFS transporter ArsK [Aminobacter sp. SR38]